MNKLVAIMHVLHLSHGNILMLPCIMLAIFFLLNRKSIEERTYILCIFIYALPSSISVSEAEELMSPTHHVFVE